MRDGADWFGAGFLCASVASAIAWIIVWIIVGSPEESPEHLESKMLGPIAIEAPRIEIPPIDLGEGIVEVRGAAKCRELGGDDFFWLGGQAPMRCWSRKCSNSRPCLDDELIFEIDPYDEL